MEAERFLSWATTHVGTVRTHNEDALVDRPDLGLWAVADGAGGHARGDVASRMIVEALEAIPPDLSASDMLAEVRQRMTETHAALYSSSNGEAHEISASTVVVLIARGDHYACLWAGDSRAYLLREGQLAQITRDHSLVQEMVDAGEISAWATSRAEARRLASHSLPFRNFSVFLRRIGVAATPPSANRVSFFSTEWRTARFTQEMSKSLRWETFLSERVSFTRGISNSISLTHSPGFSAVLR